MTPAELSALFLVQLVAILGMCRLIGIVARRCGQPQVMAEMLAGVVLGPSVFGQFAPAWQSALFPPETKPVLYCVSQLGLALYMFLVGLEFRIELFRAQFRRAAAVSITGMVVPFVCGALVAAWLLQSPGQFFTPSVTNTQAMIFLGSAMCITAFPMLARLIVERQLTGTALGTLTLAAGALDDVAAWCLLAIVLAGSDGSSLAAVWTIAGGVIYTAVTLGFIPLALKPLSRTVEQTGRLTSGQFAVLLILLLLSAWTSDAIGIHAVFGAFILGCAVPRGRIVQEFTRKVEALVGTLLVPLFFAYSGLHTRLDLIATPSLWLVGAVVLLAACLGKGVACWAAARLTGADSATALAVGALMNARGMMELILLNIARERGLITLELFAIMVVMALATTLLASPALEWVYGRHTRAAGELEPAAG